MAAAVLSPIALSDDIWSQAERQIVRLDPSVFPQLPPLVLAEVHATHCKVPQTYAASGSHNVITGSFAMAGQKDWAVMCSMDGVSTIHIFWGGATHCSTPLEGHYAERAYLQDIGDGKIGFSLAMDAIRPTAIRKYLNENAEHGPPSLDHDGIEVSFLEAASTIYYCANGHWLEMSGGD